MVKVFYAKPGSKQYNHILGRVRGLLEKHPNASTRQLQMWSRKDNFIVSLKAIREIQKEVRLSSRVEKGKGYYYIRGSFEIYGTEGYDRNETRVTPDEWANIEKIFMNKGSAVKVFKAYVMNFNVWIEDYENDPNYLIEGDLNLNQVLKFGVKNIKHWEPFGFMV